MSIRKNRILKALQMTIAFPITFLLITPCYVLGAEVIVGNAFDITPDLKSPSGQYDPRVAFDGTGTYLVAWEEGADVWQNSKTSIYAARIRVSGGVVRVLDRAGILLSNRENSQHRPRLAFGGGVFLIVWQELFDGSDYDIRGVRLTPDGQILDPEGISIAKGALNQVTPDVTYDETNKKFFVVWADFRNKANYQIYGAKIALNGSVIDKDGISLGGGGGSVPHNPIVGTNGKEFWVAWTNVINEIWCYRPWAGRYTLEGAFLAEVFTKNEILPGKHKIAGKTPPLSGIVSNGSDFVVLSRFIYDKHCNIMPLAAFRLISDGTLLNQEHPLVVDRYEKTFSASVIFAGGFYFVVWEGIGAEEQQAFFNPNHDLFASRIDEKIETAVDYYNPIIIANTPSAELKPSVAKGNNDEILIAYEEDNLLDYPLGKHLIKGRLVSAGVRSF